MLLASFFYSLMSLSVKLAGERLPSTQIVFARSVFSLVATWVMLRRVGVSPWGQRRGLLVLRGVLGFGGLLCFYYAITQLPLADVTVIFYTNPVFVGLFAAVLLGEAFGWRNALSTGLSLTGILLIARPSLLFGAAAATLDLFAVGVAVAGALVAAMAYTLVRKLRETEHPLVVVFYFPLVAVPAVLPLAGPDWLWPTPWEWGVLLAVGLFTQVAQVYMTKSLHAEQAGRATAASYTQIVFAAFWGFLIFGEVPDLWVFCGALLVVAGTLLLARR